MKKNPIRKLRTFLLITSILFALHLSAPELFAQSTSTKEVKIPTDTLKTYVGEYQMTPTATMKVSLSSDSLKLQGPGRPPLYLKPVAQNRFYLKEFGVEIEFVKSSKGDISKLLMIRDDGQTLEAPIIKN